MPFPFTPFCPSFRCWLLSTLILLPIASLAALPEYRVGVQDVDYYPIYSAVPPDYHYRGYARDLLDAFALHANIQLRYVPLPVRRLNHDYWAGRLDLIFPDSPRWSQIDKQGHAILYSQPVLVFQDAMLVLPSRLGQPREGFRKLGFIRGFTPWKFQKEIAAGRVEIETSPGPEGLIRMALSGYIDAANMARQVAQYHLAQLGQPDGLRVESRLLTLVDSHYHLSSIRHPELIRRFDAFLQTERRAVEALKQKYGLD